MGRRAERRRQRRPVLSCHVPLEGHADVHAARDLRLLARVLLRQLHRLLHRPPFVVPEEVLREFHATAAYEDVLAWPVVPVKDPQLYLLPNLKVLELQLVVPDRLEVSSGGRRHRANDRVAEEHLHVRVHLHEMKVTKSSEDVTSPHGHLDHGPMSTSR